ncbi:unnamed protein product [Trichogramma brassicae]|uniref:Secreted protein n=1 Tax=Trichogramma brassicae TaxID=86971 RepID=A0A6H5J2X5_9HYME|nr:unnamed protein product [Trichogramma brassicae]
MLLLLLLVPLYMRAAATTGHGNDLSPEVAYCNGTTHSEHSRAILPTHSRPEERCEQVGDGERRRRRANRTRVVPHRGPSRCGTRVLERERSTQHRKSVESASQRDSLLYHQHQRHRQQQRGSQSLHHRSRRILLNCKFDACC